MVLALDFQVGFQVGLKRELRGGGLWRHGVCAAILLLHSS
jgi:hypothetical protein